MNWEKFVAEVGPAAFAFGLAVWGFIKLRMSEVVNQWLADKKASAKNKLVFSVLEQLAALAGAAVMAAEQTVMDEYRKKLLAGDISKETFLDVANKTKKAVFARVKAQMFDRVKQSLGLNDSEANDVIDDSVEAAVLKTKALLAPTLPQQHPNSQPLGQN